MNRKTFLKTTLGASLISFCPNISIGNNQKITLFPFQQRIINQIEGAETNQIFLMPKASSKTFITNYIKNNNLCQSREIIDELNPEYNEEFLEDFFNSNHYTILTSYNEYNKKLFWKIIDNYSVLNYYCPLPPNSKGIFYTDKIGINLFRITYEQIRQEVPYYYDAKLLNEYKIKNPKTFRLEFECQFA